MKNIMHTVLIALTACLVLSSTVTAKIPTVVNYQGRLTDATGTPVPDGSYSVRFRMYDSDVSGTLIWEETQSVIAADGFINVLMGTTNPLDTSLFNEAERWLGIKVGADPEMVPRTQIASVPFAISAGQADALTIDPYVNIYGDTMTGSLWLNGDGADVDGMIGVGPDYTNIRMMSEGNTKVELYGQSYGSLYLTNSDGFRAAELDATSAGDGLLELSTVGGTSVMRLDAGETGNSSAILPDDAVHSDEMMNEPGIASSNNGSIITLTSTMQDLETVSIAIPDAGYIVVEAKCYGMCESTTGYNKGLIQIDESAGGSALYPYYTLFGLSAYSSTGAHNFPIYVTRVYHKESAGTYTFRLEGIESAVNGASAVTKSGDHILTAIYYPTSYGTVEASVSPEEAAAFDQAAPIVSGEREDGVSVQHSYKVDLRELELKAKQARIDALKAELELKRAQEEAAREERDSNH